MLHIANPVAFVCFFQDAVFAEGANHAVQVAVACPYGIGNIGHDIPEKGVVCGGKDITAEADFSGVQGVFHCFVRALHEFF